MPSAEQLPIHEATSMVVVAPVDDEKLLDGSRSRSRNKHLVRKLSSSSSPRNSSRFNNKSSSRPNLSGSSSSSRRSSASSTRNSLTSSGHKSRNSGSSKSITTLGSPSSSVIKNQNQNQNNQHHGRRRRSTSGSRRRTSNGGDRRSRSKGEKRRSSSSSNGTNTTTNRERKLPTRQWSSSGRQAPLLKHQQQQQQPSDDEYTDTTMNTATDVTYSEASEEILSSSRRSSKQQDATNHGLKRGHSYSSKRNSPQIKSSSRQSGYGSRSSSSKELLYRTDHGTSDIEKTKMKSPRATKPGVHDVVASDSRHTPSSKSGSSRRSGYGSRSSSSSSKKELLYGTDHGNGDSDKAKMKSPRATTPGVLDVVVSDSNHTPSSKSGSSRRSGYGSRSSSSKELLYGTGRGNGDGDKAKMKSPRATTPGVDRLRHSWHTTAAASSTSSNNRSSSSSGSNKMELLYGDKKNSSRLTPASEPGSERVVGTRQLLYGDNNDKYGKRVSRNNKSSRSSTPGVEEVDGDDDRYSYDVPLTTSVPREVSSSLTAENTNDDEDDLNSNDENKKSKRKFSSLCIISTVLFVLLLVVVGVVAGFVFLGNTDTDTTIPANSGATVTNATSAPTAWRTFGPTSGQVPPSTSARPSSSPVSLLDDLLDPPTKEDCRAISNNETIPGQENMTQRDFNLKLDVTLSVHGDIPEDAVEQLLAALEQLFIPKLVGCNNTETDAVEDQRRLLRTTSTPRRLNTSPYIIGNGDVTGNENREDECKEGTPEPEKCHVIDVELTVYLKDDDATEFDVVSIVSEAGQDDLVPLLELSPDTFEEVALTAAAGAVPSEEPSTQPSFWSSNSPSVVPTLPASTSPTNAPVVGPTPPPSASPSNLPTATASASPSNAVPSGSPSVQATPAPSPEPTTSAPTQAPVVAPVATPLPTETPSEAPSIYPSFAPSGSPSTPPPSSAPSLSSSHVPSEVPSASPSVRCYCTTTNACDITTNQFSVGCGSCVGDGACTSLTFSNEAAATHTMGQNSCRGQGACTRASIHTIADGSCTEAWSCHDRQINIGPASCTAEYSCENMPVAIDFWNSARNGLLTVNTGSCTQQKSCHSFYGNVGSGSCTGQYACSERLELTIGNNACLSEHSCSYVAPTNVGFPSAPNRIEVANNSCQGAYSCQCMTKVLVEGACNALGDCCDSSNPTRYAPGFVVTSSLS
ncbi:unnamed protein product [Cylindrotheca closterium]|uniref:DUF7640 domain-containing protein n=1 Tax=Cylindrotheca closterium TaxID=2856 RepID=A0AAD2G949_9STRA|nr:unnamed protein product [Cylindrotheca closterium]